MSNSNNRFEHLKKTPKPIDDTVLKEADAVAEERGFVDRTPRRKPGRKKSIRQFQLHPRVLPEIGEAFADEAERRGVTQGVLLEECWQLYLQHIPD